jgi:hypothetical protein
MIYIIITTCINIKPIYCTNNLNFNKINRDKRYIECIKQLLDFVDGDENIKPIIVENGGLRETYMNDFNCDIVYTNNNSFNFIHKGFNELLDIKNVIEKYNILDDDIIIKLTGRYKLLDNDFINIVKNNNKDAYVKFFDVCTYKFMHNATVLGLYAIKCKYQKNFNYDGTKSKSAEIEFAEYVRANIDKNNLMEITNLNLEYCLYNDETNLIIV